MRAADAVLEWEVRRFRRRSRLQDVHLIGPCVFVIREEYDQADPRQGMQDVLLLVDRICSHTERECVTG